MATSEDSNNTSAAAAAGGDSALLSKLGGAFFGASGSPQRVVTNIRGFLANRITGALPETGQLLQSMLISWGSVIQIGLGNLEIPSLNKLGKSKPAIVAFISIFFKVPLNVDRVARRRPCFHFGRTARLRACLSVGYALEKVLII